MILASLALAPFLGGGLLPFLLSLDITTKLAMRSDGLTLWLFRLVELSKRV